jgi:N-methylhydantoinase B
VERLELVADSDGAGRTRGGLGLRKDYRFERPTSFTILADRERVGPHGVDGGHDGRVAEYVHVRDGVATRLGSKSTLDLEPGDVVSIRTCGGGGYGPPVERDPELVLRDVREGKVSPERARTVYRVAMAGDGIDEDATAALRAGA